MGPNSYLGYCIRSCCRFARRCADFSVAAIFLLFRPSRTSMSLPTSKTFLRKITAVGHACRSRWPMPPMVCAARTAARQAPFSRAVPTVFWWPSVHRLGSLHDVSTGFALAAPATRPRRFPDGRHPPLAALEHRRRASVAASVSNIPSSQPSVPVVANISANRNAVHVLSARHGTFTHCGRYERHRMPCFFASCLLR